MNRRSYCLALGSVGLAGVSGCLNSVRGFIRLGPGRHVRPGEEPANIPAAFDCDQDGFERLPGRYSEEHLHWGDTGDFSLRVNELEFEYGDTARIELSTGWRGNRSKWNFEIYTENGWRDVRGTTGGESVGHDDDAIKSDAKLTIELTEDGIIAASPHEDVLEVCPDLVSARYRFVYWGLLGDESIAVAFDLAV